MKTIGLLGGTGWSSTITYYTLLNQSVHERLRGYHSAKILLKSIDYHDILSNYGKNNDNVASLLKEELMGLINLRPDCVIICCNSLHKFYDMIRDEIDISIPLFHAVELTAKTILDQRKKKVLLLATKFTMEDGFFARTLQQKGIEAVIPHEEDRHKIQAIHDQLMDNIITQEARDYFQNLIASYKDLDAVVLGCTEFPLVVDETNSALKIIDPVKLQVLHATEYALQETEFIPTFSLSA